MKVVLFCGGLGMRMREYSEAIPKPMVPIGYRPILWHVMKYYAHYGHKDFILCLGYQADVVKSYFLNYNECLSNDFVMSGRNKSVELMSSDIEDWSITFADTGLSSNIGERLKAVEKYVAGEEVFLANYSDCLSDVALPIMLKAFESVKNTACFVSVKPRASFHVVKSDSNGKVKGIEHIARSGARINGGFFVLRREIFRYMRHGEELVEQPFSRLIGEGKLMAFPHEGYWACMDTFKERQELEDALVRGRAPWTVWNNHRKEKK